MASTKASLSRIVIGQSTYHPPIFMPDISVIIATISTVISLIMLGLTRRDMNRRELKDQEMFVSHVYENFQELQLAFTQNTETLNILAEDRNLSGKEVIKNAMSSLWINQALSIFEIYQNGYLRADLWQRAQVDMKLLFSRPSIVQWWQNMKRHYPKGFRKYIENNILSESSFDLKSKTMQFTVIHSTPNCDSSTCPTIYVDESGNYFIQGFRVTQTTKSDLSIPEHEDVIELPKEFVESFIQAQRQPDNLSS